MMGDELGDAQLEDDSAIVRFAMAFREFRLSSHSFGAISQARE